MERERIKEIEIEEPEKRLREQKKNNRKKITRKDWKSSKINNRDSQTISKSWDKSILVNFFSLTYKSVKPKRNC